MELATVTEHQCQLCLPLREGTHAKVLRVVDGDTIIIAFQREEQFLRLAVRITGIDCPEMHSHSLDEKRMALAAKEHLAKAVDGKMVVLYNVSAEKFGRGLCDVKVNDQLASISAYMLLATDMCRPYKGEAKKPWVFTQEALSSAPELTRELLSEI